MCAVEGERGGGLQETVCICACVASAKGRWAGDGVAMVVQMNGLYRAVVMRRTKIGRVILLSLVSCPLSEVRSGRFEGRGLGVLSRLETGRRGKGRSGQRVGRQAGRWTVSAGSQDTVCLLRRVGGRPYGICVCAVTVLLSMPDRTDG